MIDIQDSINLYSDLIKQHGILRDDVFDVFGSSLTKECLRVYNGFEGILPSLLISKDASVCWYISQNTKPNAAAAIIPNTKIGVIRINIGLILRGKQLFLDIDFTNNDLWHGERLHRLSRLFDSEFQPILFDISMLFSFYHELAHIIQKMNCGLYNVLSTKKQDSLTDRQKRTVIYLEYDADIYSTLTIVDHLIHNYFDKIDYSKITEELIGDSIALLCLPLYIMMSRFQGFDQGIAPFGDAHPHPRTRLLLAAYHFITQCVDYVAAKEPNFEINPIHVLKSVMELGKIIYKEDESILNNIVSRVHLVEEFDIEEFLQRIMTIANNNIFFATTLRNSLAKEQS